MNQMVTIFIKIKYYLSISNYDYHHHITIFITIILLKKGILTLKMGKGHRLRKIKTFLKEQ